MKIRFLLAAGSALALSATALLSPAHAEEPTYEADVGGGASPVIAVAHVQSELFGDLGQEDNLVVTANPVRVVMGKDGGNKRAKLVQQRVGPLLIRAGTASIFGNRFGTPYAEAQTVVADVSVVTGEAKGTQLGTIETFCHWDRDGWETSVQLVNANGDKTLAEPNTRQEIPGLGFITFHERYTDRVYLKDASGNFVYVNGRPLFSETVYVAGAHLHLSSDPQDDGDELGGIEIDTHIFLGFTSCDPLSLPSLSGVKQFSNAA